MNNDELDREIEKETQELESYIDKLKEKKNFNFKPPVTDDYGYFEYQDDIEPYLNEDGTLVDEDNLPEELWMEIEAEDKEESDEDEYF